MVELGTSAEFNPTDWKLNLKKKTTGFPQSLPPPFNQSIDVPHQAIAHYCQRW
jgi:hypothetical protein